MSLEGVQTAKILGLRGEGSAEPSIKEETESQIVNADAKAAEPIVKEEDSNVEPMSLEEYEAALDDDHTFDNLDI